MVQLQQEFPNDEVLLVAVASGEPLASVLDYVTDTGMPVAIILDGTSELSGICADLSPGPGEESLYEHFRARVGDLYSDPPFPLQVVVDAEGRFLYGSRSHQPELVVEALRNYLDDP